MGGCALNCVANSKIKGKNIWIMPSPGDAGSALGAAALVRKKKLKWKSPYLGTLICRPVNTKEVVKELLQNKVCGVANGRAEFGPRALGLVLKKKLKWKHPYLGTLILNNVNPKEVVKELLEKQSVRYSKWPRRVRSSRTR